MQRPSELVAAACAMVCVACSGSPSTSSGKVGVHSEVDARVMLERIAMLEGARSGGTQELIKLSRSTASWTRMRVATALGHVADDASVARLGEMLADDDPGVRALAGEALWISGHDDAPKLAVAATVTTRDNRLQAAIARTLGALGKDGAAEALAALLADDTFEVRRAAALAIGVLGRRKIEVPRAVIDAVIAIADDAMIYETTYALSQQQSAAKDEEIRAALALRAKHSDPEVRALAAKVIAAQADADLSAFVADSDWRVRVAAITAYGAVEPHQPVVARISDAMVNDAIGRGTSGVTSVHPALVALEQSRGEKSTIARRIVTELRTLLSRTEPGSNEARRLYEISCRAAVVVAIDDKALPKAGCETEEWRRQQLLLPAYKKSTTRLGRALLVMQQDDPRIRAVAVEIFASLSDSKEDRAVVVDQLAAAFLDSSAAVAGTAFEAAAALIAKDPSGTDKLAAAMLDRASDVSKNEELELTLLQAITKAKLAGGETVCRESARTGNRTLFKAANECLTALGKETVKAPIAATPPAHLRPGMVVTQQWLWSVETSRGTIEIELEGQLAPWHVAAVVDLTQKKFYDGLNFHRVVPNFVIQGGDPAGTGWGGPGYSVPAEPSSRPYVRGAVGIADAGHDTGGSQWFVMQSRAPHLEGRYTQIGRVVRGMDVVDRIVVGDKIVRATVRPIEQPKPSGAN